MTLLQEVGTIELVLIFITASVFVVIYATSVRWWQTDIGRNMMYVMGSIGAITGLVVVRLIIGATLDTPWYLWLRVAVLGTVPGLFGWRSVILVRTQRQARRQIRQRKGEYDHERS